MRRWVKGLLAGLATASVGTVLGISPLGHGVEQDFGLAWLFKLRGAIDPPPEVAVIAIDDQTGVHLGLSRLPREWPRSVHARLVDRLTALGASSIVFDFDFQTEKTAEEDSAFAQAIERSNRVVLAAKLVGKRQMILDASGKPSGSVWLEQLVPPVAPLANAAKGLGPFPLPKVQVAVYDFWAFKPSVGDAATMPAVALQVHALRTQPNFWAFLQASGLGGEGTVTVPRGGDLRGVELRKLMAHTRHLFQKAPHLAPALRQFLEQDPARIPDPGQRQTAKSLISLYAGDDHRYLNFYGPPGTIATIPYHVVMNSEDLGSGHPPPDVNGKVVFVGYSDLYDPGQPDRFYTVFTNDDGVDLSGVEIAATAFGNLLHEQGLQPSSPFTIAAVLAIVGGLLGSMVYLLPAIAGVPLALLLGGGYAFGVYQAFVQTHGWLPLAIPMLVQLPLALFIGLVSQYLLERHKKNKATEAISFYLPEGVARDFTDKVLDPSAINRVAYSCCFASDMAGFTTISEQLRPKELAVFLNDYFDTLSQPLRENGVDVVEFRADGIMCAWTSDEETVAVRHQAILGALDAVKAMATFKERYSLLTQSLRIGLEVGMAYVGHAGGGGHFVYSIVGDCANTAARVEGLNKQMGTQILATQAAVEGVNDLLLRHVGDFCFVGKTTPLPVVEVIALRSTAEERQLTLCADFEQAMQTLASGDWREAEHAFSALQDRFPDDGPTKFHLARCRRFLMAAELPAKPLVVALDAK
ncbi:CHASE2 domain-containing protein [Methylotetracoccus oryzae]|uniref:CHASE2 domain-containing protein n=1 Tax=Methylotetracoccus oryzae TaxID=1919059 RepID=UPI001119432A|nr:adenylate/guanylate cyclase domain-containing protein [Methylotetracoccus oryzae]